MNYSFDVISDLYLTDQDHFDFKNQQTSMFCVVAGNISSDLLVVHSVLKHLSTLYKHVFFIDGMLEHSVDWSKINETQAFLEAIASELDNVVYLHNRVIITNGIAILGTNGWSNFNVSDTENFLNTQTEFMSRYNASEHDVRIIMGAGINDINYLGTSLEKLQRHQDVQKICVVTSAIPDLKLIQPTSVNAKIAAASSSLFSLASPLDTEHKLAYWVYGQFLNPVGVSCGQVSFVSNPKNCLGNNQTLCYYPRPFEIK